MPSERRQARYTLTCPVCHTGREVGYGQFLSIKQRRVSPRCHPCSTKATKHPEIPPVGNPCRHCQTGRINRPRGLCWGCYYTPGVKELYPSTSKYAQRGLLPPRGEPPLADPTTALPGTPEKVAVIEQRAKAGLALWHPLDAKADAESSEYESAAWSRVPVYTVRLGDPRRKAVYEDNSNRDAA